MEGRSYLDISSLPTECLEQIISLTSPDDACRLAATAVALRLVVDSDDVWEAFLPPDYVTVLQRSTDPVHCHAKKDLFFHLCNTHLLLDGGKLSFSLERSSGVKRYMLPARVLCFGWNGYPYRGLVWSYHPDSRFSEVAVLSHLCWLDVYGIFSAKELSTNTDYAAYLIYKVDFLYNINVRNQETDSKICSYECNRVVPHKHMRSRLWDHVITTTAAGRDYQPSKRPRARSDGWMELEIMELNDKECEDDISVDFRGITGLGLHKCQIVVEGIEVRPKKIA